MTFILRFDMRTPSFGGTARDLYAAACDMSEWAEEHGCAAVVLCEHHCADDGYLPSPLLLASAIAARTRKLLLNLVVILPFYDVARLAEDMAVLDHISAGRASYVFGIGYRAQEYDHFGLSLCRRGQIADEKLSVVRRLLRGEVVEADGRRMVATPNPSTPGGPTIPWGGASLAAARRAGANGLGLMANGEVPGMRQAYDEACRNNGHEPGFVLLPKRDAVTNCFIADDVDDAWDEIGRYLLHDAKSYAEWNPGNEVSANISSATSVEELRAQASTHMIITREEAASRVANGEILNVSPLCGGIPPAVAWRYLERMADLS